MADINSVSVVTPEMEDHVERFANYGKCTKYCRESKSSILLCYI